MSVVAHPPPHLPVAGPSFYLSLELADAGERALAHQLTHLASQYHGSEYNRVKFGPQGSTAVYIPLSLHAPALVQEMRTRQIRYAQQQAWWPCEQRSHALEQNSDEENIQEVLSSSQLSDLSHVDSDDTHLHWTSPILSKPPFSDLKKELATAMACPLSRSPSYRSGSSIYPTKTSESHPINISMIIPFELLSTLSLHLSPSSHPSPILFHVPITMSLDALTAPVLPPPIPIFPNATWRHTFTPSQTFANDSYQCDASGSSYTCRQTESSDSRSVDLLTPCGLPSPAPIPAEAPQPASILRKTIRRLWTESPPIPIDIQNQSLFIDRATSAPPVCSASANGFTKCLASNALPQLHHAKRTYIGVDNLHQRSGEVPSQKLHTCSPSPAVHRTDCSEMCDTTSDFTPGPLRCEKAWLGNLFMSSCPGKKVRLSGPVKGRGAICRDLKQDLGRMHDLGVRCIICCLDNDELEFLGASWTAYSAVANEVGLDVLRLPTPEGLAPLDPGVLNDHLTRIINAYTLRGYPILVHCRGGVGRAGLIASCWILKLGLCGWKNPAFCQCYWPSAEPRGGPVCGATLHLVERVITVVRRRRSLKAIETYEQVKFLVDFVEYLESTGGAPSHSHLKIQHGL